MGVLLYSLLCGNLPFQGHNDAELCEKIIVSIAFLQSSRWCSYVFKTLKKRVTCRHEQWIKKFLWNAQVLREVLHSQSRDFLKLNLVPWNIFHTYVLWKENMWLSVVYILVIQIQSGKYYEPDYLSPLSKLFMRRLMDPNPKDRLKMSEIISHPWVNKKYSQTLKWQTIYDVSHDIIHRFLKPLFIHMLKIVIMLSAVLLQRENL